MVDVVTLGETMALIRAELPPAQGKTSCSIGFGGADSNVAIGLARLGHSVRWISALGQDALGQMIAAGISQQGVEVDAKYSSAPTGLMVKTPSAGLERFVTYYRKGSAASALSARDISAEQFAGAKILHFTGITPSLSDSCAQLIDGAISLAKQAGLRLSFDLNYRPALWEKPAAQASFRKLVQSVDLVFGDVSELSMLVDGFESETDLIRQVAKLGPKTVVLKRGELGAIALVDGELYQQDAIAVAVVDTVGAGDAFVAGFLSAELDNCEPAERLLRAAFCGARACTNLGDWEGAPMRHELELARGELV